MDIRANIVISIYIKPSMVKQKPPDANQYTGHLDRACGSTAHFIPLVPSRLAFVTPLTLDIL